ncbi:hypothetical protein STEG23_000499, partial [Scotinomys teguina]
MLGRRGGGEITSQMQRKQDVEDTGTEHTYVHTAMETRRQYSRLYFKLQLRILSVLVVASINTSSA